MFQALHELWYRVRSRFRRDQLDADLVDELRTHAEFLKAEALSAGASTLDAQRAAALRLGNITNIREATRERWSFGWMESLMQDTRYAFRFLRRSPGFTTVAVLYLTLGVGANATVFAVADRLMFSAPPHIANANQLFQLAIKRETESVGDARFESTTGFDEYYALREQAQSFASVALYTAPSRAKLGRGPDAPIISPSMVTANFFDVLGVRPVRGRFLLPDDEKETNPEVATVISYNFWQSHFAGADSAVGARFSANELHFVVVGIAPGGFSGVVLDAADLWTPLGAVAKHTIGDDWKIQDGYNSRVLVRVRDGVLPATASAEASVIVNRTVNPFDAKRKVRKTALLGSIISARSPATQSGEVQISTKLVVASAMVLFAACANLANLLLVRALTRRREIALRLAIGVSRLRLASQMLIESLIIAALGSAIALVVARWSGDALRSLVFPEMQWATAAVNTRVFLYSVACGTLVAVLATLIPAIRFTRTDIATALRSAAPQMSNSIGNVRRTLLVAQVAIAVLLIVGATAFTRSLTHAYEFDMGIDVNRLITARFSLQDDSVSTPTRLLMYEEAARRVRGIPGIEAATVVSSLPLNGQNNAPIRIPERELPPRTQVSWWPVTPALQRMGGFHLVRGRWFTADDVAPGMPPVVLMSESMANMLWPGLDAVGRCLRKGADSTPCLQVVGVIHDLRPGSFRDAPPRTMLVSTSEPKITSPNAGYVVARTKEGVELSSVLPLVNAAMHNVRSDISSIQVQPLAQKLDRSYRPLKLGTITFGSFALLAIILSAVGLYGVLAFSVTQRTGEFGIRAALGARASHLVRNVVGEGVAIVAAGTVVGVVMSWYASSAIAAFLFESSAHDAAPYVSAIVILGGVAMLASALPAWRATRVDPATALRAE